MRILYDSRNPIHKEPFGTVTPTKDCRITVHLPGQICTLRAEIRFTREDGAEYMSVPMDKTGGDEDYEYYSAVFRIPEPGLFFYYFRITTENEEFSLYKYGESDTNMEEGGFWQLSCIPDEFEVPEGFEGKVMYQIFPDRFYAERILPAEGKLTPYWIHEDKSDISDVIRDADGEIRCCDFYGGNLEGITKKLDYIKGLGASVIYLNPVFKAYSNHRYDTADYKQVDELLGTEEDLKNLFTQAHNRGMKVILDGVFSHTGSNSRYFDIYDIWGNGACHHEDSPYRDWYSFKEGPEDYASWWGIKTLPEVNELTPSYMDYIINDEDSVIAHWLNAGADGFRLDVADELPDEFIIALRKRVKEINPDAIVIGEVWDDASNKISYGIRRRYFTGMELDSVMNYPLQKALII